MAVKGLVEEKSDASKIRQMIYETRKFKCQGGFMVQSIQKLEQNSKFGRKLISHFLKCKNRDDIKLSNGYKETIPDKIQFVKF